MRPRPALGLGFLAVAMVGCGLLSPRLTEDRSTWSWVDAEGQFSFLLPPSLKQTDAIGIDSFVRTYESWDVHLAFDYGTSYGWGTPNCQVQREGRPDVSCRFLNLGTARGMIVRAMPYTKEQGGGPRPYQATLYAWEIGGPLTAEDLEYEELLGRSGRLYLVMYAECRTSRDCDIIEGVLESVRFPARDA